MLKLELVILDETQETFAESIKSEEEEEVSWQQSAESPVEAATELWPRQAKQLVINLYPKYLSLFENRAIVSKEKMFAKIAEEMQTFGYTYSGEQVKNRWRCFEKSYKTYMQHNSTLRGRERRTVEFAEELHGIFHKESRFYPEVVTSSDKTMVKRAAAISVSTMSERSLRSESATPGDTRINHRGAPSSTVTVHSDDPPTTNKKAKYTYKATSTVLEGIRIEMKRRNDLKEKQVELQKKRNELIEKNLLLLEKHLKTSE